MDRVPINGETLTWAREVSGLSPAGLASAIDVNEGRLLEYEEGTQMPTFKQLVKIAHKLDRTPAFFFLPPPDEVDVPRAVDYRRTGNVEPTDPELIAALRRAERYRDVTLECTDGEGIAPELPAPFRRGGEGAAAGELRRLLGLQPDFVPPGTTKDAGFQTWRRTLETHGFLVFQTSKVDLDVFRGLSIFHERLPIILLNGKDSPAGKAFTLFHEVAHIVNRSSGLCLLEERESQEALANSFAAHFLMPSAAVLELVEGLREGEDVVEAVARRFKVSRPAAAIRLKVLGYVSEEEVLRERRIADAAWSKQRGERKGESGPPYWRTKYRDLGPTVIGAVTRALDEERIGILDAANFLDAKIPIVDQLVSEYRRSGVR